MPTSSGVDRAAVATGRPAFPARYRLIGATFSLSMLLYVDRAAISAARAPIAAAFNLDDTRFGWVLAAFALGYALLQAPVGALADRFGPRRVLTLVVAVWSAFTALTAFAWNLASLLVVRLLFGAGEAGAYPTIARAFYSWLPAAERGFAQGINLSGSRIGAAFALPAVAWLVDAAGWRVAFLVLGAAGAVWAAIWYAWFRDRPEDHAAMSATEYAFIAERRADEGEAAAAPLGALLTSTTLWYAMGQYFASNFTFFFCLTWLFPYLQRTYHLEALRTGLLASAPLLGGAVGNWIGGLFVDALYRSGRTRLSRRLPAAIGFALAAAGLLASLAFHDAVSVVMCLTVAVFGADMTLPSSWALCIDLGRQRSGTAAGMMNMAGNLGSFVTSLAFPYLLVLTGTTTPFFVVGAALNLAAVWMWLRVDESAARKTR